MTRGSFPLGSASGTDRQGDPDATLTEDPALPGHDPDQPGNPTLESL
jgi:hypothetical protein